MRLLKLNDDGCFSLLWFPKDKIPPYAILSHTWGTGEDDEVTFKDLVNRTGENKGGFQKLRFCGSQAKDDDLHYFWVDTCCIDKSDTNELTTAINSMFRWYQNAARCYVYLSDVSVRSRDGRFVHAEWESAFRNSRWFMRGWTLQELLAPKVVDFYSRDHIRLGDKHSLGQQIVGITGIAIEALRGRSLSQFSIEERFSWTEKRQTTMEEDQAYCLLGIFGVFLPLIYGEGQSNALRRLRKEIRESIDTESQPIEPSRRESGMAIPGATTEDAYVTVMGVTGSGKSSLWRRNHTLSLDGGGVRGYSQLIILKVLMDEVARIERSRPDEDGNPVESSFHPCLPVDDKSIVRPKEKHRRRRRMKKEASTNGQTNGDAEKRNGKGKEVGRHSNSPLSEEAQEELGKFYPYHYFDYIAGTSTGGLNAIMLGRLRMSVDECISGYADLASKVFGRPRFASYRCSPLFWFCAKYSSNRLRDVVKDVVDEHLCEGEGYMLAMNKEMCRTVVLAMKRNPNKHEMVHLFRTYNHHRRRLPINIRLDGQNSRPNPPNPMEQTGPADSSLIWEVALATSAAPTYFNTIKIGENEYGDAGFGENNPSTRLFWEVCQMNNDDVSANELSISIGTGISRFTRFQTGLLARPIRWVNAAKKVSTDCEKAHIDMERFSKLLVNHKYVRFNVPEKSTEDVEASKWQHLKKRARKWFGHGGEPLDRGLGKIKLDEWKSRGWWRKESTQEEIERVTKEYLKDPEVVKQLEEVAGMMVSHRRARARTDRWETYALGIRYKCPLTFGRCPDDTWTDEGGLRRHLEEDHEYRELENTLGKSLEQAVRCGKYYEDHN